MSRIALALPQTTAESSRGPLVWCVKGKGFVWERPLRRGDLEALGADAPDGPILCAHVEHVEIKEALLGEKPDVYFTTPHFKGYRAVLVRLERISVDDLQDLIIDAWLTRAPKRVAADYLARSSGKSV